MVAGKKSKLLVCIWGDVFLKVPIFLNARCIDHNFIPLLHLL